MISDPLQAARALGPTIKEAREETESQRRVAEAIVRGLVDSQLCRLAVPSELGGLELDPVAALEVYEELARAEASVAWIVWSSSLPCMFGRFLSAEARHEIFGDPEWMYASSIRPTGRVVTLEGGRCRLTGRWSLVSGSMHAEWICLLCMTEVDGELKKVEGQHEIRGVFVRKGEYEIVDTWHVGGLRGTGSHDVIAEGAEVPPERTFGLVDPSQLDLPIGRHPIGCTMASGLASICLGMAQAAVDAVTELAASDAGGEGVPALRDRPMAQYLTAASAARIAAHRTHLHHTLRTVWNAAEKGSPWTQGDLGAVWGAAVTAARECQRAVSRMYQTGGANSLYSDWSLERAHRDIHAALHHFVIQPFWLEQAGRAHFGLEPTHPFYEL